MSDPTKPIWPWPAWHVEYNGNPGDNNWSIVDDVHPPVPPADTVEEDT